ncbi:hypothetical protein [Natrinema sp. H-ect4]|uniref:hypothetical protein n=1 Tax=Natrinema sp. H-ect4 TaxID=3242699 RepID=UPI0035A82E45
MNEERKEILYERIGTPERGEETSEVGKMEIETLGQTLELKSSALNVARAIYQRAVQNRTIVENCRVVDLAVCSVYLACRIEQLGFDPVAVSKESMISQYTLKKIFPLVKQELDLEIGPVDPENHVQRYCENLGLSEAVEETAIEIIEATKDDVLSGRSPSGFAASAVYASSLLQNEKRTQRQVSRHTGVSARTIRDTYQLQIHTMGIADRN